MYFDVWWGDDDDDYDDDDTDDDHIAFTDAPKDAITRTNSDGKKITAKGCEE